MSETEMDTEVVGAGGVGGGDELGSFPRVKKDDVVHRSDPDKIVSLGMVEDTPRHSRQGEDEESDKASSVYRTCSVDTSNDGVPQVRFSLDVRTSIGEGQPQFQPRVLNEEPRAADKAVTPSWSITKLLRRRLFPCCNQDDAESDDEPGIEMQNLCASASGEPNVDEVDGEEEEGEASDDSVLAAANEIQNLRTCSLGPVMTVDCSKIDVDAEIQRLKASLGDVIRKLIIRNAPIKSAMKIFNEPLLNENVTSLHFQNCDLSVSDLCLILGSFKRLEQLNIEARNDGEDSPLLKDDFVNARSNKDYFQNVRNDLFNSVEMETGAVCARRLKVLTVSVPMTWQCTLICRAVEVMIGGKSCLEEINIQSSLKDMLINLMSTDGVKFDEETSYRHLVTLEVRDLIQKSSSTLKHLSIACSDVFPLEYLRIQKTLGLSVEDMYRWSFLCTCGVLSPIGNFDQDAYEVNRNSLLLPVLTNLRLDLPLVPVTMARDEDFRRPLNEVAEFLANNNGIHVVTLLGLRPIKGMENWIRNSLVTIPKFRMNIGCTYTSTTLACNLTTFDDELGSLGIEIPPEETRQRVSEIIDPDGKEVIPHTWRYNGLKCFHLVNKLPSLMSYDLSRIASKFSKLTKLTIEDFATQGDAGGLENMSAVGRSLNNQDMQTIFEKLVCLEYLHLDCNMENMTDRGLSGVTESLWSKLTTRGKNYSFWYLYNLRYLFMRGFGDQVTDKSAVYAFSEEYSMKNLQELHLFAPGFTNFGREKIRRAYEGRTGFILEL